MCCVRIRALFEVVCARRNSSLCPLLSILLSVFVPISLWVTMEIVRFVQARFMQWDSEMFAAPEEGKKKKKPVAKKEGDDESTQAEPEVLGMIAKTSSLNEDLGRVRGRCVLSIAPPCCVACAVLCAVLSVV